MITACAHKQEKLTNPQTIPLLIEGFPEGGPVKEGLIDQIQSEDNHLTEVTIKLRPEDIVQKSLIQIDSSEHKINIQEKSLEVCSEFKVTWDILPNDLLIIASNEEVPSLQLKSLSIDNLDMKFSSLRKDIPTFAVSTSSTSQILETHFLRFCYSRSSPENRSGLKRITTADLLYPARLITDQKKLGYDLRPVSFFSFGDVSNTRFILNGLPKDWTLLASSPFKRHDNVLVTDWLKAGRFTALLLDKILWNIKTFESSGTDFQLLLRKSNAVIKVGDIKKAVRLVWPKYVHKFGNPTPHVVIADLDWDFISGGLIGTNIVGLFSLPKISAETAKAIGKDLSWKPGTSTRKFVELNYKGSKSPWNDYLIAMVSHELAHFYFGLGKTQEYATQIHDMWFSLGMGMVYDRQVTEQIIGRPDIFFDQVEKKWHHQFHNNSKVDQRLIGPNTSGDKSAKLSRSHVYAHGKASYVLRDLRQRLGEKFFDNVVKQ